jgi:sec-independent protein translocase protein TatB
MFDIAPSEMLIVALVAIVLIGPKDLPRVMRVVGQWVGRGRSMARHFRGAIDDMIRESELQEMEKKWKAENERIMREHSGLIGSANSVAEPETTAQPQMLPHDPAPATPAPAAPVADATPPIATPADAQRQG